VTDANIKPSLLDHRPILRLSDSAFRVWMMGIVYGAAHETDGFLDRRVLALLHPDGAREDLAQELVNAGRWKVREDGWQIDDFLTYQTSHADRVKQRAEWREAKKRPRKPKPPTASAQDSGQESVQESGVDSGETSYKTRQDQDQDALTGKNAGTGDSEHSAPGEANGPLLAAVRDGWAGSGTQIERLGLSAAVGVLPSDSISSGVGESAGQTGLQDAVSTPCQRSAGVT